MSNGFYIITGASRGIGEALAQKILQEGNRVLGISRNRSDKLKSKNYFDLSFDLTDTSRINIIKDKINEIFSPENYDFVCLINNAAVVGPLGPIDKCPQTEIELHAKVNLIAPMLLTSMFIDRFSNEKMRKKVVFISSGAAFNPLPDQSIYCSSKAGINMFTQSIGLEQKNKEYGFEVNSIGPGMVDTPMQLAVRSKPSKEFAMADYFKKAFEEGKLQDPNEVAEKIYKILINKFEQGKYISVNEV